jgi:hypothetical protein
VGGAEKRRGEASGGSPGSPEDSGTPERCLFPELSTCKLQEMPMGIRNAVKRAMKWVLGAIEDRAGGGGGGFPYPFDLRFKI